MKLYNAISEKMLVCALLERPRLRQRALQHVHEDLFGDESAREVYVRMLSLQMQGKKVPTVGVMANDPGLSPAAQILLKLDPRDRVKLQNFRPSDMEHLLEQVRYYYKKRVLYEMAKSVSETLSNPAMPDMEEVQADVHERLLTMDVFDEVKKNLQVIGHGANISDDYVREHLSKKTLKTVPTGLQVIDDRAKWTRGNMVLLTAKRGQGKSLLAKSLGLSHFRQGQNVITVNLEMENWEYLCRLFAEISPFDHDALRSGLSDEEIKIALGCKKRIDYEGMRWEDPETGERRPCRWALRTVTRPNYTPAQLHNELRYQGYDVVIIDYINLFKQVHKDLWHSLYAHTKYLKMMAKDLGILLYVLAQLSDEGRAKYARAAEEDCLTGDTLISTERGLVRLDEQQSECVLSDTEYVPVERWHTKKVRPTKRMVTKRGYSIRGTYEHEVLTFQPDLSFSWKHLEDLQPGDTVLISRAARKWPEALDLSGVKYDRAGPYRGEREFRIPTQMTPDLARVLSYRVSGREPPRYETAYVSCFGVDPCQTHPEIESYLRAVGLNTEDVQRTEIPWSVLQAPKECAAEFVRTYLGGAWYMRVREDHPVLSISSGSRILLRQLQVLLLGWGVMSTYSDKPLAHGDPRADGDLTISGRDSSLLIQQIGDRMLGHVPDSYPTEPWCFDTVARVEEAGDAPTFDLTNSRHRYTANGIVVHNCDAWLHWEINRGNPECKFFHGKARHYKPYSFPLIFNYNDMSFVEPHTVGMVCSNKRCRSQYPSEDELDQWIRDRRNPTTREEQRDADTYGAAGLQCLEKRRCPRCRCYKKDKHGEYILNANGRRSIKVHKLVDHMQLLKQTAEKDAEEHQRHLDDVKEDRRRAEDKGRRGQHQEALRQQRERDQERDHAS